MKLHLITQAVEGRECGSCSLCCKLPTVEFDGYSKDLGEWCKHCSTGQGGCAIYEDRPTVCKKYHCTWLGDAGWPVELSPRKTNCIVMVEDLPCEDGVTRQGIRVHENVPHAVRNIEHVLMELFWRGVPVAVYDPQGIIRSVVWDREGKRHTLIKLKPERSGNTQLPSASFRYICMKGVRAVRAELEAAARKKGLELL